MGMSVLTGLVSGAAVLVAVLLGAVVLLALLLALGMLVGLLVLMMVSVGVGVVALVVVVVYLVRIWTLNRPAVQQDAETGAGEAAAPGRPSLDGDVRQSEAGHRLGDHLERHP